MCDQGQMISLSYKQADPSYTVDSGTRVTFPDRKYITTDQKSGPTASQRYRGIGVFVNQQ